MTWCVGRSRCGLGHCRRSARAVSTRSTTTCSAARATASSTRTPPLTRARSPALSAARSSSRRRPPSRKCAAEQRGDALSRMPSGIGDGIARFSTWHDQATRAQDEDARSSVRRACVQWMRRWVVSPLSHKKLKSRWFSKETTFAKKERLRFPYFSLGRAQLSKGFTQASRGRAGRVGVPPSAAASRA